jgi:nifR3 family TIM-barrel protein
MFDLNAGCPSDRVCEARCGAELLDDLARLQSIIRDAVKASDVPVSVKVRARGHSPRNTVEQIARAVEDSGAAMLTVHARGRQAKYSTGADWETIARAKEAVSIPVIGNGDVFSSANAHALMDQTGCDAVMIARGSLGTPWIFRDIAEGRSAGITAHMPSHGDLYAIVRGHLAALRKEFGDVNAVPRMRKHLLWYIRWYRNFEEMRKTVFLKESASFLCDVADSFFETPAERFPEDSREFQEVEARFRRRVLFWTIPVQSVIKDGIEQRDYPLG